MRRLLTTLLTAAMVLAAVAPASADDKIGLSPDGEQWVDSLSQPLFDSDTVWVPGDSRTVSFYVRNQATTNATLTASVRTRDGDDLVADHHIVLRARVGDRWFALRNGKPSPALTDASIRPGAPVRVDIEAGFDPTSSNASQTDTLRLMFEVTLTDAAAGPDPAPGENVPGDVPTDVDGTGDPSDVHDDAGGFAGWLPDTGAETPVILIWMAGTAIVVGAAVAVAGRRKGEREDA